MLLLVMFWYLLCKSSQKQEQRLISGKYQEKYQNVIHFYHSKSIFKVCLAIEFNFGNYRHLPLQALASGKDPGQTQTSYLSSKARPAGQSYSKTVKSELYWLNFTQR